MSITKRRGYRWLLAFALAALLPLLAACEPPTPAEQSKYNLTAAFHDPKVQALALAAEKGNATEVRRLMKEEHINPDVIFTDDNERMPLIAWPVFTDSPEGLRAMLENGANPNVKVFSRIDGDGVTRYHANAMVWASKKEDPLYLKLLLDHGGDPNTRNGNDETLLFQAFIWHNQWRNVQLLVERGADVNSLTFNTPILDDYTSRGGFEMAYWLLEHGADPMLRTLPNESANYIGYIIGADPTSKTLPITSAPSGPDRHPTIESIFWHPGNPTDPTWQRKCQQWLLQHGYKRPPMPSPYREMRRDLGFPYEEKDIPLL